MPAYYDESTKTWYCQFYYTEWTGERKKKKKRGFDKKKDALEWERIFLSQSQGNTKMTFEEFQELYFNDMKSRLRESSIINKKWVCDNKITPYFKSKIIEDITPSDIRKWQAILLESDNSPTYNRMINTQFSSIMNYAVRYYGLPSNPVRTAGTIGKGEAEVMDFYTKEEFDLFIHAIGDKEPSRTGFLLLYFSGIRIGELLALNYNDFDTINNTVTISKTFRKIHNEDIISPPKTNKGNRIIPLPQFVIDAIIRYKNMLYGIGPEERLFNYSRHYFTKEIKRATELIGLKRIRVHDFRHSHASLLIELGFSPLLISERLGHEKVETTLNTYSHLYPNKQNEIVDRLQDLEPKQNHFGIKKPRKH